MTALLTVFRDLLFLRAGPQDLPHSPQLLSLLIIVSVIVDLMVAGVSPQDGSLVGRTMLALGVLLGMTALALAMTGRGVRFVQTASALIGTGIAVSLLALPIVVGAGEVPTDQSQLSTGQLVRSWLLLALVAMQLAVFGNILRHALEVPLRSGVLLAIAMMIVHAVFSVAVFGLPTG